MRRLLYPLYRFLPLPSRLVADGRGPCRNPRFVSFLAQSNRKALDTDLRDAVLAGRKLVRRTLLMVLIAGGVWIAIESARALTVF